MAGKLDIHVTPEAIERNFMMLNRILEETEAKLQEVNTLADAELQNQTIKNEINTYIAEQVQALNNHINTRLKVQQRSIEQLELTITGIISDIEIIKGSIAIHEQQIQENSQRLQDIEQVMQTIETKVANLGTDMADVLSRLAVLELPGTGG